MRLPSPPERRRPRGLPASLLGLLAALLLALGSASAAHAAPSESAWISVDTTAQGQLLTKLQQKLVADYGQTAPTFDYGVVKKLRVTGTLSTQDYADLRSASYAGTSIHELDLSGVVDATAQPLNGMTELTDVSLPPVASFTLANPFQGTTNLRRVVVAAETYVFGSATTFNGISTLERITFLHTTKPSTTQLSGAFAGSNNADPANRTVVAAVPDEDRGDYDKAPFQTMFSDVVETATADDREELQTVIDEASALPEGSAAAPFRWTLLQRAIADADDVHDDTTSTAAEVYRARLALQTAISRLTVSDLGLSIKATKGADVTLSWKNGTAQHFAEFVTYPLAKVDAASDATHDVYVPTTPVAYSSQKIASAVIPGQTDKTTKIFTHATLTGAQYLLELTPLAGRVDTAPLIPGFGSWDNRGLYTNLGDTGVVELDEGEHFDLDTIRTQQAQLDQVNNLFIEPDYTFEVAGDSVSTRRIGADGRRQLRIAAERPGVSVVKITYGPLHYLNSNDNGTPGSTNWSFNGIDPQSTGVAVVQVGDDRGTFDTGIDVRNDLDTFYFDRTVGSRDYTFTPAAGTTVRVHDPLNVSDWGQGWHGYEAAPDGSFTVKLKGGRNIIELEKDGKRQYRVVRAKGVDVAVTNATDPGQPFQAGDTARIEVTGVEGGVEKLGGIYNPAFSGGTWSRLTYRDPAADGTTAPTALNSVCVSKAPTGAACRSVTPPASLQYQTAGTTFAVEYPYTGEGDEALEGFVTIGGLGAEFPYHRQLPLEGKPANLAAVAIGPFDFGGLPQIYVRGDQVSTTPAAPATPTALQATAGNAQAELSWTAPTATGGLPVLGYRVRSSSDGGQTWQTTNAAAGTTRTLTDLVNGTEYEVQVAALNRHGQSAWTTSVTVTPRTVPGVPTGVTLTPRRQGAHVAWTAPASDGGSQITGYRVRHSADGGQTWTTADHGTATEQVLTDLTDGTAYTVQVAALNANGASDFSPVATVTPATTGATLGGVSVTDVGTTSATVRAEVTAGDLGQDVTVEYATNAEGTGAKRSAATAVPAGSTPTTVPIALSGLDPDREVFHRVVLTATDGTRVTGSWTSFRTVAPGPGPRPEAPTVALRAGATDVRVGDTVRLTWTASGAQALVAGGDWSGGKALGGGAEDVVVRRAGVHTFALAAIGAGGATSATVTVRATLAPATLGVRVPAGLVRAGGRATVSGAGLSAGETYRVIVGAVTVGRGTASASGAFSRSVSVPVTRRDRTLPVRVVGSLDDRAGTADLRVVAAKKRLTVRVLRTRIRQGLRQRVSVSGLAAGERVRLVYRGTRVAVLTASRKGTVTRRFAVGRATGARSVTAYGLTNDRRGAKAFRVVR